MKRFEYKVMAIPTTLAITTRQYDGVAQEFEQRLNQLGEEGWELVQRMDGFFFLMREREETP